MSKLFAIGPVEMFEETLEIGGKQVPYFRNDEFSQVVFSASAGLKRLLFNEKALGEAFTVSTSEHHTWGEIADYYKDICNLNAVWIEQHDFLKIAVTEFERFPYTGSWQLVYDRLFDRVIDNSKVLETTGMKQKNMRKLYDGLKYEISRCPSDFAEKSMSSSVNIRMDEYLQKKGMI